MSTMADKEMKFMGTTWKKLQEFKPKERIRILDFLREKAREIAKRLIADHGSNIGMDCGCQECGTCREILKETESDEAYRAAREKMKETQ